MFEPPCCVLISAPDLINFFFYIVFLFTTFFNFFEDNFGHIVLFFCGEGLESMSVN